MHMYVCVTPGFTTARALAIRHSRLGETSKSLSKEDLAELNTAITDIEKHARKLSQISTWAKTIVSNGEKILKQIKDSEKQVTERIELVNEKLGRIGKLL